MVPGQQRPRINLVWFCYKTIINHHPSTPTMFTPTAFGALAPATFALAFFSMDPENNFSVSFANNIVVQQDFVGINHDCITFGSTRGSSTSCTVKQRERVGDRNR